MEFRLTDDSDWMRLRHEQARQMSGTSRMRDLTAAGMADLLGEEEGDDEDEDANETV